MEKPNERFLHGTKTEFRWLRKVLLPFWVCRILLLVMMAVAQIASVYWISQELDIKGSVLASLVVVVLFAVLCVSMDAVSMILLGRNALKPIAFLVIQAIETTLWTGLIVVEIINAVETSSKRRNFLIWFIAGVLYLSFIGLLTYAAIIFRRPRLSSINHGEYAPAHHEVGSDHSLPDRTLRPTNPFDNAYAASAHSRSTSVASLESVFPPPPAYEPSRSSNTPPSSNSFVIITSPEEASEMRHTPNTINTPRFA